MAIRGKTFRVRVPLVSQRTFLRCELSGIEWTATAQNWYMSLTHIEHHVREGVTAETERVLFFRSQSSLLLNILLTSLWVPGLFEHFDLRSTNTSPDVRIVIKAGGFWTRGVRAFFLGCVASVSERFRSKERGTRVKDRAKNGSRFISKAVKTENRLPRSFFALKLNGNACYEGYIF